MKPKATRAHFVLFHCNSPYRSKRVVELKTRYKRRPKHRKGGSDE